MRRLLILACAGAWCAVASPARAANFAVGGDLGVMLREEASGQRSPLPALGPRLELSLARQVAGSLTYRFALDTEGRSPGTVTQHHLVAARPELRFPARAVAAVLGVGPSLAYVHATFEDGDRDVVAASYWRLGVSGIAALDFTLRGITFRAGAEAVYATSRRFDVIATMGLAFRL